jgi:hypothetical protein
MKYSKVEVMAIVKPVVSMHSVFSAHLVSVKIMCFFESLNVSTQEISVIKTYIYVHYVLLLVYK